MERTRPVRMLLVLLFLLLSSRCTGPVGALSRPEELSSSSLSEEAAFRHNERGVAFLNSGDFRQAIAELRTALRHDPTNPRIKENLAIAYNNHGFHLMERGRTDLALDELVRAYEYFPSNPYTVYNLGRAHYELQNITEAERYLSEAYDLDSGLPGLGELLLKVRGEEVVEKGFDTFQTRNFIISFSGEVGPGQLTYIRTYLEQAYDRVGRLLDHYPAGKTPVLLYTRRDYEQLLGERPYWMLAMFDGKVRIPVESFSGDRVSLQEIIFHEYAHAVVYDLAGADCPLWLNEGIAGKAESLVRRKDGRLIRSYLEEYGLAPFMKLPDEASGITDERVMTLIYVTSYLAVEFIIHRYGRAALNELLVSLGGGASPVEALYGLMGEDLRGIDTEWARFVRSRYSVRDLRMLE